MARTQETPRAVTDARILYVDDDASMVDVVSETLDEAGGFDVISAGSVDAALESVRSDDVDCVVSEVDVSERSIASFVDAVRAVAPDLPVVLYTDSGNERLAAESVRAGVTDYVVNDGPDGRDRLVDSLDTALAGQRTLVDGADFRERFDRVTDAFLSVDDDWRITYVNESGAAFLNHAPDELVGRDLRDLSQDGTARFHDEYLEVLETGSPTTFETEAVSKPGHWVEIQAYPAATGLSIYWRDVTDARRRKRVLAELHDGARDLLAATTADDVCSRAVGLVDSVLEFEGGCLVSEATSHPGRSPADTAVVVERSGAAPDDRSRPHTERATALLDLFRSREEPLVVDDSAALDVGVPDLEPGVYTPAGPDRVLVARSSAAIDDFDVYCLQLLGTAVETALVRTRREQELASNRSAIHSLHDSAIEFQSCSRTAAVLDVAIRTARDVISFDRCLFARHEDGMLTRAMQSGGLPGTEVSLPTSVGVSGRAYRTGETVIVDDSSLDDDVHQPCPFRSLLTVPIGEWGVFQAVSERPAAFDDDDRELAELLAMHVREALARVRSDQALRRERDLLAAFFESSSEPVVRVRLEDDTARVERVNTAFEEVFGVAAETIVGDPLDDHIVPPEETDAAHELNRASSNGEPVEATITRLAVDGRRDFLFRSVPLRGEDGGMLAYGIYVDITARTEHLRELERYQTIVESTGDPVYTLDADGYLTYVNEALVSMTGYDASELVGEHMRLLVPDEGVETSRELIRELLRDDDRTNDTVELDIHCADGSQVRCEIHIALLPSDDGFVGTAGAIRDITDREARKRELEAQNQRLEEFASVVSHDLRNPLQIAQGHLDLAQSRVSDGSLERVDDALARMETIVGDVLALARNGAEVSETEPTSLAETAHLGWATVDTGAAQLTVDGDGTIQADPNRLRRLFENLFRNSVEHGSTSPHSYAREDSVEHGSMGSRSETGDSVEHGSTGSRAPPDDNVERGSTNGRSPPADGSTTERDVVSVRVGYETDADGGVSAFFVEDDGPGVPEPLTEEVFEAGYSTTEDGTGIGLDIVRSIASAHGWDVALEPGEGGGARFVFSL